MGQAKRALEEKSSRQARKKSEKSSLFFTWRPTPEDVGEIETALKDPAELVADLDNLLLRDISLKLSYNEKGGSYVASAIEASAAFGMAKGLSVWHDSPSKALLALLVALDKAFPEFPDSDWPPGLVSTSW